jgi:hypothetical protein
MIGEKRKRDKEKDALDFQFRSLGGPVKKSVDEHPIFKPFLNRVAWSAIQVAIRHRDLWCVLTYDVIRSARSSVPAAPRSCLTLHATLFSSIRLREILVITPLLPRFRETGSSQTRPESRRYAIDLFPGPPLVAHAE